MNAWTGGSESQRSHRQVFVYSSSLVDFAIHYIFKLNFDAATRIGSVAFSSKMLDDKKEPTTLLESNVPSASASGAHNVAGTSTT